MAHQVGKITWTCPWLQTSHIVRNEFFLGFIHVKHVRRWRTHLWSQLSGEEEKWKRSSSFVIWNLNWTRLGFFSASQLIRRHFIWLFPELVKWIGTFNDWVTQPPEFWFFLDSLRWQHKKPQVKNYHDLPLSDFFGLFRQMQQLLLLEKKN